MTGQAEAEATEAQGEAGAAQANAVSATAADTGLTSALVSAGNAAALALSGAAGVFSTAVSGAQRAWKIAAATANGDHNTDQAVAKFNAKMAEWWAEQGQSDPVSTAVGIVNTLVTAIAGAESAAATTMGNALTTAVTTIGTADVAGVTTVTNADKTYSTESVGNDKTYLDGMATGEADYLKVVANKWHEFRTGAITAAERDSAISAKWTEFQAAAITNRNTFRVDQATDAATFRNAVVGAAKTHVDAVTTAAETLNDGLQNAQKTLATSKWNAWLTASKGLVNLDAESTIAKAESLAVAIDELATENPVSGFSGSGQTQTNWSAPNPFWTALAAKADQSAEYIADTKNAERLYYGRSPWSDNVNGAIIEHQFGTRGVLDARRDYEVGMSDATATQNKALQHTAGTRDRELAAAAAQLAQSRGAYEISWANLNLESSGWHLDQSALPITGADDGTISVTPGAGTNFVPGWFSVPRLSEAGSSSSTSTGFNATDLDSYFMAGLMPDMPGTEPVTSGKVSRDDSRFTSAFGIPAEQDGNQITPGPIMVQQGDDDPGYTPPTTITVAAGAGEFLDWFVGLYKSDESSVVLPGKPPAPGNLDASLGGLTPTQAYARSFDLERQLAELEARKERLRVIFDNNTGTQADVRAAISRDTKAIEALDAELTKLLFDLETAYIAASERHNPSIEDERTKLRDLMNTIDAEFREVMKTDKSFFELWKLYDSINGLGPQNQMSGGEASVPWKPVDLSQQEVLFVLYGGTFAQTKLHAGMLGAVSRFHQFVLLQRRYAILNAALLTREEFFAGTTPEDGSELSGEYLVRMEDGSVKTVNFSWLDPLAAAYYRKQRGMVSALVAEARDRDMIDFLAERANAIANAIAMLAGSLVPGVGEGMDGYVMVDPTASWWAKTFASGSLLLSIYTYGLSPNFGALFRVGDDVLDEVYDLASLAKYLDDFGGTDPASALRRFHALSDQDAAEEILRFLETEFPDVVALIRGRLGIAVRSGAAWRAGADVSGNFSASHLLISIRNGSQITVEMLLRTAAHEATHAQQLLKWGPLFRYVAITKGMRAFLPGHAAGRFLFEWQAHAVALGRGFSSPLGAAWVTIWRLHRRQVIFDATYLAAGGLGSLYGGYRLYWIWFVNPDAE